MNFKNSSTLKVEINFPASSAEVLVVKSQTRDLLDFILDPNSSPFLVIPTFSTLK